MNLVYFSLLLCLWLPFYSCIANAQYAKSLPSEIWRSPLMAPISEDNADCFQIEIWQPLGVKNLNGLEINLTSLRYKTARRFSLSVISMPGYRRYKAYGSFGLFVNDNFYLEQELGFGIGKSVQDQTASYFIQIRDRIEFDISEASGIIIQLTNWPDLVWNGSDLLSPAGLHIRFQQFINEQAFLGIGLNNIAGSDFQMFVFSCYKATPKHELFAGLSLNPIGFGIGYAYQQGDFLFRFLLEGGTLFGYSPYTALSWKR